MAAKIRRNDEVIVLVGKDKNKKGKVTKVISTTGKVIVEGINLVKKHQKPVPTLGIQGGIVEQKQLLMFLTLQFSTQLLVADRIGFRFEDGKKVRFFKV